MPSRINPLPSLVGFEKSISIFKQYLTIINNRKEGVNLTILIYQYGTTILSNISFEPPLLKFYKKKFSIKTIHSYVW